MKGETMSTRWHDLIVDRLKDGGIRLEQRTGLNEPSIIQLHPQQLLSVARQLCGVTPETALTVAELQRRISVLVDKLQDIVCDRFFRGELLERCGDSFGYLAKLDAVVDLALEFDGGRLTPEYRNEPEAEEAGAATKSPPAMHSQPVSAELGSSKPSISTKAEAADSDGQMGLPV